jgi:hypothetical protein
MAEIPENVTLRFLAEQNARILGNLDGMRKDDQARDVAIAALSVDLKATKAEMREGFEKAFGGSEGLRTKMREGFCDLSDRLQIVEGRLNTIDGRLARIEKHTGLVKA